jgi:hypothetical protein
MSSAINKLEKLVRTADEEGKNIVLCYDEEDGFWVAESDRAFSPDPAPLENGVKHRWSLTEAINAV